MKSKNTLFLLVKFLILNYLLLNIINCQGQTDTCVNIPIDSFTRIKNRILFDKETGTKFILDSTQTLVEAKDINGKLIWHTNPWKDNKLSAFMWAGCAFIISFHFANDERTNNEEAIMIGYNVTHFGFLNKKTGKFTFLGND